MMLLATPNNVQEGGFNKYSVIHTWILVCGSSMKKKLFSSMGLNEQTSGYWASD